jgi:hypothetical protein
VAFLGHAPDSFDAGCLNGDHLVNQSDRRHSVRLGEEFEPPAPVGRLRIAHPPDAGLVIAEWRDVFKTGS